MHQGFFKGIKIGSNDTVCLSHLFYADDAVFIGGVKIEEVLRKATLIGCDIGKTPFKYLGVMVGTSMLKIKAWDSARLSKWKVKTLSIGGRLTLIKSGNVRGDRKLAWVSWDKVLANKETQRDALWVWVVKAIHGFHGSLDRIPPSSKSSTWIECVKGMIQLNNNGVDLMSFVSKRVGDGDKTMFWLDPWLDGKLLKNDYPRVFALEEMKEVSVGHKLVNGLSSGFRREPRGGAESSQMEDLHQITYFVELTMKPNCWVWSLNPSGLFSVASAGKFIEEC
ncbi:hypothetical protein Tco_1496513 [Tanacetum coccineum]